MEPVYRVLVFEASKCVGCRLCEQWCSFSHYHVFNPTKTSIKITRDHELQKDYATFCHQCTEAPCITKCKFKALSRHPVTAAIVVNQELCTGCRMCIHACPYGAPSILPDQKKILICDLCQGDPQCVANCPEQAIQFLENGFEDRLYRAKLLTPPAPAEVQRINQMGDKK